MSPRWKQILAAGAFMLLVGFLVGRGCAPGVGSASNGSPDGPVSAPAAASQTWTCSMHPQVRLPEPGQCPICFMDLVPASEGSEGDAGTDPRTLRLTTQAVALAEIETVPVERRRVAHPVHMVGKIALDETRMATITAWVPGRLDRLFVDYTGVTVRAGDHLVEIYSPTLYSAQQELLQAIATSKRLSTSSLDLVRDATDQTVVSAREKLRLYGLADEQIHAIVEQGAPDERVTVLAPIGGVVVEKNALEGMYVQQGTRIYTIADLSKVWVLLDAYESDLSWLRYGQDVEFRVEAWPGEVFHGRVAFIDPLLDDHTRTVKVRLNVENEGLRLKPDMFVSATAEAVLTQHGKVVDEDLAGKWMCPMHPEIVADGAATCSECGMDLVPARDLGFVGRAGAQELLVIPASAPLITGRRAVVYVRLEGADTPTFEGREVVLGPRAGDGYVVREGLAEGERVVVRGNFKLDSELQIRARPSMMSMESEPAGPPSEAPDAFRAQLGAVLGAYLRLQEALAADNDEPSAARELEQRLGEVEVSLLDVGARAAWSGARAPLFEAASQLAAAVDIEQRRGRLEALTESLVPVLEAYGYRLDSGDTVGVFHCPMVAARPAAEGDEEGADWLQIGERTANPYFGSQMLRCGSRLERLQSGD